MRKLYLSVLVLSLSFTEYHLQAQPLEDGLYATIYTQEQNLIMRLFDQKTPMSVANFVGLAEGTVSNAAFDSGRPFFDGSSFDRVIAGHVIQAGVPNSEKMSNPGYVIPNEIHPDLHHSSAGILGMANAGPNTGSSVFYITLGDRSYLDGDYTVFGQLIDGNPGKVKLNTMIDSVRIARIGPWAEKYYVDDKMLKNLIKQVEESNNVKSLEKRNFEEQYINQNYPTAIESEQGWLYIEEVKGKGKKVKKLNQIELSFKASTPQGIEFGSTRTCSSYWIRKGKNPDVCSYTIGETSIVKGLDEAVLEMREGSKWTIILKPEYAYGLRGYYPPLDWGESRFHLSPNTTIIYELEIIDR